MGRRVLCLRFVLWVLFFLLWGDEGEALLRSSGGHLFVGDGHVRELLKPEDFDQHVLQKSGVSIVLFYAAWCPHCHHFAPTYKDMAAKFALNADVHFSAVDCAVQDDFCRKFGISAFPTMKAFNLPAGSPLFHADSNSNKKEGEGKGEGGDPGPPPIKEQENDPNQEIKQKGAEIRNSRSVQKIISWLKENAFVDPEPPPQANPPPPQVRFPSLPLANRGNKGPSEQQQPEKPSSDFPPGEAPPPFPDTSTKNAGSPPLPPSPPVESPIAVLSTLASPSETVQPTLVNLVVKPKEALGGEGGGGSLTVRWPALRSTAHDRLHDALQGAQFILRNWIFLGRETLTGWETESLLQLLYVFSASFPGEPFRKAFGDLMEWVEKRGVGGISLVEWREKIKEWKLGPLEPLSEGQDPPALSCPSEESVVTCQLWTLLHFLTVASRAPCSDYALTRPPPAHISTCFPATPMQTLRAIRTIGGSLFSCDACRLHFSRNFDNCDFERCEVSEVAGDPTVSVWEGGSQKREGGPPESVSGKAFGGLVDKWIVETERYRTRGQPSEETRLKDFRLLVLWLWRLHNSATMRIAADPSHPLNSDGKDLPPPVDGTQILPTRFLGQDVLWPPASECSTCRLQGHHVPVISQGLVLAEARGMGLDSPKETAGEPSAEEKVRRKAAWAEARAGWSSFDGAFDLEALNAFVAASYWDDGFVHLGPAMSLSVSSGGGAGGGGAHAVFRSNSWGGLAGLLGPLFSSPAFYFFLTTLSIFLIVCGLMAALFFFALSAAENSHQRDGGDFEDEELGALGGGERRRQPGGGGDYMNGKGGLFKLVRTWAIRLRRRFGGMPANMRPPRSGFQPPGGR
uniref:Sulfhydryl oxidase n=1 Tax=Chromera velia CCMP2878 TaxID=1169474 RepID=A0A0G4IDX5_9ALVE|eukprot:Cvel_2381.t1-p1 / transcript=Cvel_2381.t1 / gene=Cvel_2381 / organism=Chromera_velia_CCMP2878 / gene_product=Protein disulfide isomerase-like 2-2, putative / transcript_product=Protein disulfide isomerase-like 2-2, putative / location=Cvel_scaffold92:91915-95800(-) / protein_length=854 / sequence_SO=supercontig / SO=protein_coding / is_pseudo=false